VAKRSRPVPHPMTRLSGAADFQPDYSYIRADLRRIGLIAGTFVVLLLLASLFVR